MTDKFGELNQILSDQCEAQALTIGISDLMEKLSDNFVKDSTEREYLEIHKDPQDLL